MIMVALQQRRKETVEARGKQKMQKPPTANRKARNIITATLNNISKARTDNPKCHGLQFQFIIFNCRLYRRSCFLRSDC
jgi:hypothetical protein